MNHCSAQALHKVENLEVHGVQYGAEVFVRIVKFNRLSHNRVPPLRGAGRPLPRGRTRRRSHTTSHRRTP